MTKISIYKVSNKESWENALLLTHPYQNYHFTSHSIKQLQLNDFCCFTGPKLPIRLHRHTMVQLGNGLAIIGGWGDGHGIQAKIHLLNCMNRKCSISTLNQELSVPRQWFLAIPIPDTIAGCISGGKKCQKKGAWFICNPKSFLT